MQAAWRISEERLALRCVGDKKILRQDDSKEQWQRLLTAFFAVTAIFAGCLVIRSDRLELSESQKISAIALDRKLAHIMH